jgi:hypothetical protein
MKSYNPVNIRILLSLSFLVTAALFFSSCRITSQLNENEYLLKKNKISIISDNKSDHQLAGDLERYCRQKPNKKMFRLIPFHAATYILGDKIQLPDTVGYSAWKKWKWKRKAGFKSWVLQNSEAPVILDSIAADRTVTQMSSYLFTRGYFNARAERYIVPERNRKAVVHYLVYPGEGHRIRSFNDQITTPAIKRIYDAAKVHSLVREGAPYDEKLFQQERDRITRILKDSGYYHFDNAYITIEVDTFVPGDFLDVYLRIADQSFQVGIDPEEIITKQHQPSRIRNIYINPEYEGTFSQQQIEFLPFEYLPPGSDHTVIYQFSVGGDKSFSPAVLIRNILLEPGQLYSLKDVELTYLYLSDLANFRNISITFSDVKKDETVDSETSDDWIDCYINLTRKLKQAYEVRFDLTNRAGEPGVASNLVYDNRNLFKGAENLSLTFKGAFEVQQVLDKSQSSFTIIDGLPFNTVELGADADVRVPGLVTLVNPGKLPKTFKPRTRFAGGVNFQERPDFRRYILKFTTGYEWQYRSNISMALNPFELNSVSIDPDPSFIEKINALNDQRLKNSYTDHIITAMTYSMVMDNQVDKTKRSFSYVRFNLESAGLVVNAFREPLHYSVNSDGTALIFNIPYAQYIRADVDFRKYYHLRQQDHLIAARFYLGLGNPFGNMNVLPFEKSFFVGGANGIRAWQVRSLGPGSYYDSNAQTRFDRTGDLGIESSLEYRFPVYSSLHGAVFLDAGNVWLKNKNDKYPGGEFKASDFLGEMGLGTGFGFRFVSFFVIRIDAGIRLHDPSREPDQRWVLDEISLKRINWNFGIGYSI